VRVEEVLYRELDADGEHDLVDGDDGQRLADAAAPG
jgi:hypothetical protein